MNPRFAVLATLFLCLVPFVARAFDATPEVDAGYDAYNRGDFATALRLFTREADAGNSDALMGLEYMYVRGSGVRVNTVAAADLARRAAEKGNPEGIMALGYKYWLGVGVPKDLHRAVELDCRAIALGNPRAMNNLAVMYDEGAYVPHNVEEARFLWQESAERGHALAAANLGLSYLQEAPVDIERTRVWLRRGAEHGVGSARVALARLGEQVNPLPGIDGGDKLEIYPKDMPPGVAHACGELIS
jgi:uncharacterized protein